MTHGRRSELPKDAPTETEEEEEEEAVGEDGFNLESYLHLYSSYSLRLRYT